MNEQEPTQGEATETPVEENPENNGSEGSTSPGNVVEEGKILRDQIIRENKRAIELIERGEKLKQDNILSGKSSGGQPKEKPKKMTPEEISVEFEEGRYSLTQAE